MPGGGCLTASLSHCENCLRFARVSETWMAAMRVGSREVAGMYGYGRGNTKAKAVGDEQRGFGRSERDAPRGGGDDLFDHPVPQLLAFPQRHDAVAGPGAVPDAQGQLRPQFRADRPDHAGHAGDLVAVAADRRIRRRLAAAALFSRRRHGVDLCRAVDAGECEQFPPLAVRRRDGRDRLGGVPSRGVARGADGVGRAARAGPIAVSGRRQCRLGAGADPGGVYRDPARAGQRRLVFRRGAGGDDGAVRRRQLVSQGARRPGAPDAQIRRSTRISRAARSPGRW